MGKLSPEGSRPLPVENYMGQAPGYVGQAKAQMTSVSGDEQGANPKPTRQMNPQRAAATPKPAATQSLHDMADKLHPVRRR